MTLLEPSKAKRPSEIARLYAPEYDIGGSEVLSRYVIIGAPRSGSTLLALEAARTGQLGLPLEYLNLDRLADKGLTGERAIMGQLDELERRRTSLNGVFGIKLFAHFAQCIQVNMPNLFEHIFYKSLIVHLRRRDRLAQAISIVRARQTGRWFSDQIETGPPEYNFNDIDSALRRVRHFDKWCEELTANTNVTKISVLYEDICCSTTPALKEIADGLGIYIEEEKADLSLPHFDIQRDELSGIWAKRFRQEMKGERSPLRAVSHRAES